VTCERDPCEDRTSLALPLWSHCNAATCSAFTNHVPLLAIGLGACSDARRPRRRAHDRRQRRVRAFAAFTPLPGSAACVAPPAAHADFATCQPLIVSGNLTQRIILDQIRDFTPVAEAAATFPTC
jgi:hypothetical protein